MSTMSVSVFGEEVKLEVAIDDIFKKIQTSINNTHYQIREMCMDLDREDDFKVSYEHHVKVGDYVDDLAGLFKELKSVTKQVLGKPDTPEDKVWLVNKVARRKQEIQMIKDNAKLAKKNIDL
tara:strand:+ start:1653 stop:2018 length:366 start_codon:yes stop_codon:yes gene_type:complete